MVSALPGVWLTNAAQHESTIALKISNPDHHFGFGGGR
jgi:hypothetical protein